MTKILFTIQRTDNGHKEYAGGILQLGQKILSETDNKTRKIVLWINSEEPFFINEDVADDILDILHRTANNDESFEVKKYSCEISEVETKTFKQERGWKL